MPGGSTSAGGAESAAADEEEAAKAAKAAKAAARLLKKLTSAYGAATIAFVQQLGLSFFVPLARRISNNPVEGDRSRVLYWKDVCNYVRIECELKMMAEAAIPAPKDIVDIMCVVEGAPLQGEARTYGNDFDTYLNGHDRSGNGHMSYVCSRTHTWSIDATVNKLLCVEGQKVAASMLLANVPAQGWNRRRDFDLLWQPLEPPPPKPPPAEGEGGSSTEDVKGKRRRESGGSESQFNARVEEAVAKKLAALRTKLVAKAHTQSDEDRITYRFPAGREHKIQLVVKREKREFDSYELTHTPTQPPPYNSASGESKIDHFDVYEEDAMAVMSSEKKSTG